jgi:hypothetical protein
MHILGFGHPLVVIIWFIIVISILFYFIRQIKNGQILSIFSYVIFNYFFMPIIIQYPFTYSEINIFATGTWYQEYIEFIDQAFIISLIGFFCFIISYILFSDIYLKLKLIQFIAYGIKIWSSSVFSILFGLIFISIFLYVFYLGGIEEGGMRYFSMQNPQYRPLINYLNVTLPFFISILCLSFSEKKKYLD